VYTEELKEKGIDLKGKSRGYVKVTCPKCSQRRKKKKDPCLSVNINEGWYKCHNDDCDFQGNVAVEKSEKEKVYVRPEISKTQLGEKTLQYLIEERKISLEAIERFKLTESVEWFSQRGSKQRAINFNYYRKDQLINIKYRDGQKNFKMAAGAELILYGLDNITGKEWALITEGELDALSFYTAGVYHVASVPNGSPGINPKTGQPTEMKLEYLDNCYEELKDIPKIYLSCDQDIAGKALQRELARRLGVFRVYLVELPEDCKDANDVLNKHSSAVLKECFQNAKPYPLEGVEKAKDVEEKVRQYYENGFPQGEKLSHYPELNEHITWWQGEFCLFTGFPGHGKSNWMDNIIVDLAKEHGWKFGVFSAEKPSDIYTLELIQKYFGKSLRSLTPEEYREGIEFVHAHFTFLILDEVDITLKGLMAKAKELVMRQGINCFILDNWAYVEHKIPHGKNMEAYIGDCMTLIRQFCKNYRCSFFLVAHPKKPEHPVTNKWQIGDGYIVSGSAHFFNKVDNGFTIFRDYKAGISTVRVWKVRWWFIGNVGFVEFTYNKKSFRYEGFLEGEMTYDQKKEQAHRFAGQPDYTDL